MRSYEWTKRGIDVVGASAGLLVLAPILGATAVAVALKLGRPVLFKQSRVGLQGRRFTLVKFRSMLDADPSAGLTDDDARLTPFGRALRATSLDELPTLWNVLRGDMTFVGPRPLLEEYMPLYSARQARRHEVRPGVTGLAQVTGRNALSWEQRLELDVRYVESRGLLLDAKILLATVGAVVSRRGISAPGHATQPRFRGTQSGAER